MVRESSERRIKPPQIPTFSSRQKNPIKPPVLEPEDKTKLSLETATALRLSHLWVHVKGLPSHFHYGGMIVTAGAAVGRAIVVAFKTKNAWESFVGFMEWGLLAGTLVGGAAFALTARSFAKARKEKEEIAATLQRDELKITEMESRLGREQTGIEEERSEIAELKLAFTRQIETLKRENETLKRTFEEEITCREAMQAQINEHQAELASLKLKMDALENPSTPKS